MYPIIFARVASMRYYKGITENDRPKNGGSFVSSTGMAHECYNFDPIIQDGEDYEKCIGYCQLSGGKAGVNQMHIEKIVGCKACKKEDCCENVTVVFVARTSDTKSMRVVGFYKNATVFRRPRIMLFDNGYEQTYWFEAKAEDCVLLPYETRINKSMWYVPCSSKKGFGMGQSGIWYAGGEGASDDETEYVERMINSIDNYHGENWMNKEV